MSEWPMVKLGEMAEQTNHRVGESDVPVYSVTKYDGFVPSVEYFKKRIFSTDIRKYKLCTAGDFAYATIHLDEGSIGIAPVKCGISPMYTTFRLISSDIFPDYLLRYLKSSRALTQYLTLGSGSAERRKSIKFADLRKMEIPLPPLGEQKRIAEILGGVSKAIHAVEQQLQLVESACVNSFERKFNLEMQNGARDASSIADFIESTQYGTSKKAKEDGDIPILRMGNVTYSGKIDMTDLKYIDLDERELEKFSLKNGDLLFNRTNSVELVGKTAVFESISDQIISYAGYLVRARVNADSNPYYVSGYLNSPSGKAQLRLRAKAIVGMANINAREFLSLEIPVATKEEQEEFAHLFEKCEKIRHLLHRKLSLLQELQKSLATRAFAGLL